MWLDEVGITALICKLCLYQRGRGFLSSQPGVPCSSSCSQPPTELPWRCEICSDPFPTCPITQKTYSRTSHAKHSAESQVSAWPSQEHKMCWLTKPYFDIDLLSCRLLDNKIDTVQLTVQGTSPVYQFLHRHQTCRESRTTDLTVMCRLIAGDEGWVFQLWPSSSQSFQVQRWQITSTGHFFPTCIRLGTISLSPWVRFPRTLL